MVQQFELRWDLKVFYSKVLCQVSHYISDSTYFYAVIMPWRNDNQPFEKEGKKYSTQMILNNIKKPSPSSPLSYCVCDSNQGKLRGARNWKKKEKKHIQSKVGIPRKIRSDQVDGLQPLTFSSLGMKYPLTVSHIV